MLRRFASELHLRASDFGVLLKLLCYISSQCTNGDELIQLVIAYGPGQYPTHLHDGVVPRSARYVGVHVPRLVLRHVTWILSTSRKKSLDLPAVVVEGAAGVANPLPIFAASFAVGRTMLSGRCVYCIQVSNPGVQFSRPLHDQMMVRPTQL